MKWIVVKSDEGRTVNHIRIDAIANVVCTMEPETSVWIYMLNEDSIRFHGARANEFMRQFNEYLNEPEKAP